MCSAKRRMSMGRIHAEAGSRNRRTFRRRPAAGGLPLPGSSKSPRARHRALKRAARTEYRMDKARIRANDVAQRVWMKRHGYRPGDFPFSRAAWSRIAEWHGGEYIVRSSMPAGMANGPPTSANPVAFDLWAKYARQGVV